MLLRNVFHHFSELRVLYRGLRSSEVLFRGTMAQERCVWIIAVNKNRILADFRGLAWTWTSRGNTSCQILLS